MEDTASKAMTSLFLIIITIYFSYLIIRLVYAIIKIPSELEKLRKVLDKNNELVKGKLNDESK